MKEKIYIKNMVCPRCITSVRDIFRKNGIGPESVELGTVTIDTPSGKMEGGTLYNIRQDLVECGFEMIDDRRMQTVEQIRINVIEYVRHPEIQEKMNLSEFIQKKCLKEYSSLSKLFTEVRGMTIERYCILQKIEYVKELLFYGELNISEIADMLHYSSTAHLSAQFKSVTGMSPTAFRRMKDCRLSPIDKI